MATLAEKLSYFNFVTVMNASVYVSTDGVKTGEALCTLDSLRVANFTQEGPTKTAKGGLYANTLARYGKTMRLEMEDVIGRIDALETFMGITTSTSGTASMTETFTAVDGQSEFVINGTYGADPVTEVKVNGIEDATATTSGAGYNVITLTAAADAGDTVSITYTGNTVTKYSVTDKFSPARYIEGTTFVIDEDGNKQWINIVIPSFLPDSTFNLNLESEGDFGVININGEVQANACGEFMYFADELNSEHTC